MQIKSPLIPLGILVALLSACADDVAPSSKTDNNTNNTNNSQTDTGEDASNNTQQDMGEDAAEDAAEDASSDMEPDAEPDAEVDMEPSSICGNGIVETGEQCETGDPGCGSDCQFTCGNAIVDAGEACDTAIPEGSPGACPTACDDADACTTNTLQGTECTAECVFGEITACVDDDGCCNTNSCNANTDNDCQAICGNGVVEGNEICDGDCPSACNDNQACTTDVLMGSEQSCDAQCEFDPITACVSDDGCCPTGCNSLNDNDCSNTCGNNIVEAGETCDGNCPATCTSSDVCVAVTRTGNDSTCNVLCVEAQLGCVANVLDGCCASGCDAITDGDCAPVCGNGVVEPGEECDGGAGCSAQCTAGAVTFRLNDLDLMDPHIFANLPFLGCSDITNSVPFNVAPPINQLLQDSIQCDGDCASTADDDGFLDLSFVLRFRPFVQTNGFVGVLDVRDADCTAPLASTTCAPSANGLVQTGTYTNAATGTCLAPVAGTTGSTNPTRTYSPTIASATGPCFSSGPVTLSVAFDGITIPLQDARVGASYVGNPATSMSNGLLRGFLSEADADSILLPASIQVVGGQPLSVLLRGGTNNCSPGSDKDVGPDGATIGWWFYFNFPANQVTWTGP